MFVEATGHLIDSGLLSRALDCVTHAGARYRIVSFDIGEDADEPSRLRMEVTATDSAALDTILENLGTLGFSTPDEVDASFSEAPCDGVAPGDFYSTTNLPTRVRMNGTWINVSQQRMDAMIVVSDGAARCVKLRDLAAGQAVVVGQDGIRVTPDTKKREVHDFAFMSTEISSERRVEHQAKLLAALWQDTKREGGRVIVVAGPVVVHAGQNDSFAALIDAGFIDGLLAGNALAVHDVEAVLYGTSLGVSLETGEPVLHGHMHHMRAINAVRAAGGLAAAVDKGLLTTGVMHALVANKVPFCLAGSIRDDGPLPDTEMDLVVAQERYAELLVDASLVIVLGTMLHGIGVGNMLPASVPLVCVDIQPTVATKLADRGSSHNIPIVTDVGLFLLLLRQEMCP